MGITYEYPSQLGIGELHLLSLVISPKLKIFCFIFACDDSLSIKEVNDLLDKVAYGNMECKKADTKKALQGLLRSTSALEQVEFPKVWCINQCYFTKNIQQITSNLRFFHFRNG